MNQWRNESSCAPPSSSSIYRDDKNNNSSCFNNSPLTGKDEVIDALVAGGGSDICSGGSVIAGWTNPNGILNGIHSTTSCASNTTTSTTNNMATMNGIRNNGMSSSIATLSSPLTTASTTRTTNINSFGVVGVGTMRGPNEKSPAQVVTPSCSVVGGGSTKEKSPFAFATCVATTNNTPPTSTQPGATSSNDGPFQNNWHPRLQSCSFPSSTSSVRTSHRNNAAASRSNSMTGATSSHEVSNLNVSSTPSSSLSVSYSTNENGEGNNIGDGGGKHFGGGGNYGGGGVDDQINRCRLVMDKRSSYTRGSNNVPSSISSYTPENTSMIMMTSTNTPSHTTNPVVVGHHHQRQSRSNIDTTTICNNNNNTNTSSNPYFSRHSSQDLNRYEQNQHCAKVGGVETSTAGPMKATLQPNHYQPYPQDRPNNHYFNCNQQRKRSFRAHSVIMINLKSSQLYRTSFFHLKAYF